MKEICGIYQNMQESSQEGQHIILTDEVTGIQVLEHKYPDNCPPWSCAKMEFEYIHYGTTSQIDFFDVEIIYTQ